MATNLLVATLQPQLEETRAHTCTPSMRYGCGSSRYQRCVQGHHGALQVIVDSLIHGILHS